MEATGHSQIDPSDLLPKDILGRIENLYPKLSPISAASFMEGEGEGEGIIGFGTPALEMPSVGDLSTRVSQCSFRVFDEPAEYVQNKRAKEYVSWSVPRSDAYRIYFNTFSRKVYIDLNGKRWNEVRSKLEEEQLFCDILRTLIWVLTCEVELFEAREADKDSDKAVSAHVIEIVIP